MKHKKYEFTGLEVNGLKQIIAIKSFRDIKKGTLGGWISSEENLEQNGTCWVYPNAIVMDEAVVYKNGWVYDKAIVSGSARIYGDAWVFQYAQVGGEAQIRSSACVYGNSIIEENVIVEGDACVFGTAYLTGNLKLRGYDKVFEDAIVYRDRVKDIMRLANL